MVERSVTENYNSDVSCNNGNFHHLYCFNRYVKSWSLHVHCWYLNFKSYIVVCDTHSKRLLILANILYCTSLINANDNAVYIFTTILL